MRSASVDVATLWSPFGAVAVHFDDRQAGMKTLDDIHLALREGTVDAELIVDVEELIHRWLAEKHLGVVEAWPAGIVPADMDAAGIEELHASLVVFVREHMDHPQAGLAVWAIGKLARVSDEPLFAAALEKGLQGDDNLLYQAVIALDNLEVLPGDIMSFSGDDVDINRQIARDYLDSRSVE